MLHLSNCSFSSNSLYYVNSEIFFSFTSEKNNNCPVNRNNLLCFLDKFYHKSNFYFLSLKFILLICNILSKTKFVENYRYYSSDPCLNQDKLKPKIFPPTDQYFKTCMNFYEILFQ